ncbi:hypothetical protein CPB83DRAFT_830439 [Crepidotus variabilis]|uniref:Uncharacterized protein n=1 Tax=Crepidotus variabilis TaxID=179855 RepID=A0A9P6JX42_9AGAR|nr:hypothetical protein CPB83DRAFT_830439 [Crepidotus variabilis]
MFGRIALVSFFTLFLTGQVFAAPVPMPLKVMMRSMELEQRAPEAQLPPLDTISLYKRQEVPDIEVLSIRQVPASDVLGREVIEELSARADVPVEVAVTALDGIVTPYRREDVDEIIARQISPEVATTALDGIVKEYRRDNDEELLARQQSQNQIPPEVATKTDDQDSTSRPSMCLFISTRCGIQCLLYISCGMV